jgi:ankyrin repeat protein
MKVTLLVLALLLSNFSVAVAATTNPLVTAAQKGDTATVKRLLASGTDPNSPDKAGLTALNWAAFYGWSAVVEALIAHHANVNSHGNEYHWTPLMNATHGGFTSIASFLIAHGADVNARDTDGYTALLFAELGGHRDTVALLRARGAHESRCDEFCLDVRSLIGGANSGLKRFSTLLIPGAQSCNVSASGDAFRCTFGTDTGSYYTVTQRVNQALPPDYHGRFRFDTSCYKGYEASTKTFVNVHVNYDCNGSGLELIISKPAV